MFHDQSSINVYILLFVLAWVPVSSAGLTLVRTLSLSSSLRSAAYRRDTSRSVCKCTLYVKVKHFPHRFMPQECLLFFPDGTPRSL